MELESREGLLIGTKSTTLVTDALREMSKLISGTDENWMDAVTSGELWWD